jgi:hypothetical protein
VCALKFCTARKNNNGTHGVHSIGRAQRNLASACTMWVYVVSRQFSEWCAVRHTKLWHGVACQVKCAWNISVRYKKCVQQVLVEEPKMHVVDIGT